jgi:YVTN family beta-propeller protein
MKSRLQALWLFFGASALLLLAMGCNDTLRQFITPIPPPTGDPSTLAHAVTLSTNPLPSGQGSDMHVDVSGDTSVGIVPVGINPVFLGKVGGESFIINGGDGTTPPTVSFYLALLPLPARVTTTTLPAAPSPDAAVKPVAGGTSSSGNIFIANRDSNNISVISANVLAVTATIPLPAADVHPVMIAGNGANNQMFVINQQSGTVTQISTLDNTVVRSITVGSQPIWGVMSSNGLFVFVVNQGDGTISVIDASTGAIVPCPVGPSCPAGNAIKVGVGAGSSPNFAFYEPKLQRLFVSNTGENTISVINVSGISATNPPVKLKDIAVSGAPTSVTALPDGTRAYAALGNCVAGVNHTTLLDSSAANNLASCNGNLVSIIDAIGLRETGTVTVGAGAVSIDASGDSSRVFVIGAHDTTTIRDNVHVPNCSGTSCLPGPVQPDRTFVTPSISVIRTTTNSVVATTVDPSVVSRPLPTFHVPQQDPRCVAVIDPNFNNKVPMPCAMQSPFALRTFP